MKPRKSDIARLQRIVDRMEAEEARLQRIYGDATKGSVRGSFRLDYKALKNVLFCALAESGISVKG